jgi:threonine/homoserine/homoserine lactone efflux protein
VLAATPGPGIFYVLARSLHGGRRAGVLSSFGTAIGGFGHVLAAAWGLSAILASSAAAFTLVKYAGAAYLVWLGCRTLMSSDATPVSPAEPPPLQGREHLLVQGMLTELLNPKTALFFLAFIPQFVEPARPVFPQFVLLGTISVTLNTIADLLVAHFAGPLSSRLRESRRLRRHTRVVSGGGLIALGAYVALADERR